MLPPTHFSLMVVSWAFIGTPFQEWKAKTHKSAVSWTDLDSNLLDGRLLCSQKVRTHKAETLMMMLVVPFTNRSDQLVLLVFYQDQ